MTVENENNRIVYKAMLFLVSMVTHAPQVFIMTLCYKTIIRQAINSLNQNLIECVGGTK